jgi:Probable zinc-ribbon domain
MAAKSDRKLLERSWVEQWRTQYREALNSSVEDEFQPFEPSQPHTREDYVVRCPCCLTKLQALDQKSLLELQGKQFTATVLFKKIYLEKYPHFTDGLTDQLAHLFADRMKFVLTFEQYLSKDNTWRRQRLNYAMWACDDCLSSGKAEVANFENAFIISCGCGLAPYFYFDYDIKCDTCQKDFTYTKEEQRWAYETLIISAHSILQHCSECRRKKHEQHVFQQRLHLARTAPEPFEHLQKVSQLMLEHNDPRSLEYLRRAKNKAPNLELKQILERQIKELLTQ